MSAKNTQGNLVIKEIKGEQHYALDAASVVSCGSSRFADITVKGSKVARKHLRFFYQNGFFMAEALGKLPFNINGADKIASVLHDGDVIQLGMCEILFYQVRNQESQSKDQPLEKTKAKEEDLAQIQLSLKQTQLMLLERTSTQIEIIDQNQKTKTLTKGFHWEIDPPENILVNEANELIPMKAGPAKVGVRLGAFFDVVDVTVQDLPLEEITLIIPDQPLYEGESTLIQALGSFHDESGTLQERGVTHLVEWVSCEPQYAQFSEEHVGELQTLKTSQAKILARYGNLESAPEVINIDKAILKHLNIHVDNSRIEAGDRVAIFVEGVYSNNLKVPYREEIQWEIKGDPCLRIEDSFLEALTPGHCQLKAFTTFFESNVLDLSVMVSQIRDGELILPDELTPGKVARPTLRVLAKNGQTYDVQPLVSFQVDNPTILESADDNCLKALREGFATVSTHFLNQKFVKSVQVTENPKSKTAADFTEIIAKVLNENLPLGLGTQVSATGINGQGQQTEILNEDLVLRILTPETLLLKENQIIGLSEGKGQIEVSFGSLKALAHLTITPAKLVKIKFDPPAPQCNLNEKVTLKAYALYSNGREVDITDRAQWSLPRELVGTPRSGGLEPIITGKFSISCRYEDLATSLIFEVLEEKDAALENSQGPNRFGDLVLKKVVGVGGMGRVFLAQRIEDEKQFAVKVVRNRLIPNTSLMEQFIRESRILSQFHHENIVSVYRYGKKGLQPYMVMEYLQGKTLAELVKDKGSLPLNHAIAIIRDVARALHVLHAHNPPVIHRDIKPGNTFLTYEGLVKLMDFGITRTQKSKNSYSEFHSKVLGTASYISPEQAKRPHTVNAQSDLYSLGSTFFTLITGHPPFTGETSLEIVLKHLNESPPRPSTKQEGIPQQIDNLILKMLAKDPKQRPKSAAEIILELEILSSSVDLRDCFL